MAKYLDQTGLTHLWGLIKTTLLGYVKSDAVADSYDDTATYQVGDIVMHEGNLYKCTTAVATAEAFNATKWQQQTVLESASPDTLTNAEIDAICV